jgi:hypothetical protein
MGAMNKAADGADWLVLAGLALLGGALWLWFGLPAALAYVGTVLVVVGLALAVRRA